MRAAGNSDRAQGKVAHYGNDDVGKRFATVHAATESFHAQATRKKPVMIATAAKNNIAKESGL
jgi:hypothetical protein